MSYPRSSCNSVVRNQLPGTYQLPPSFLLRLLCSLQLVVLGDVTVQRAQHDHGHHAREEEHNHERIDDGKPVDGGAQLHGQIHVPALSPGGVAFLHGNWA